MEKLGRYFHWPRKHVRPHRARDRPSPVHPITFRRLRPKSMRFSITASTTAETTMATEPPTTTSGPDREQTAPTTQAPDVETTIQTTTKEQTEAPATAAPAPDTETTTKEQTEAPATAAPAPDTETTTKVTAKQTESPVTAAPTTQAPDAETTTKAKEETKAPTAAPAPDTETTTKAQITTKQTEAPVTAAPTTPAPDTQTTMKEQTEAPATPAPAPDTETTTKAQEQTEAPVTAAPVTAAPVTAAPITAAPAPETTTKAKEQTEAPTAAPAPETTTKAKEQTEPPVTAAPVPAPETTTKAQEQTEAPVTAAPAPETTTKAKEQTEAPVTAAPVPAPETTTKAKEEQTDAPATAAPAPETTTKAKEQTDSPVTAAPVPAPETTKAPEPVTEAPAPEPVTDAPVEVTTAQFNTSGFTGSVSTYFTIGTSDSSTITISFGVEIILKMTKEKTFTFVFVLQVRSSGTVTETFSSMASLAALSGVRQETVMGRAEVNEEGTDTTTFVSALDRQNKTSTSNNTECLYTMEVILMKIQFTNKLTGELYPCDLDNQANAEPPYLEIIDHYNNTVINRYCYLDKNVSIHSFGDQMFGYIVTNGDPNIVPDIQAVQIKEEFCCGGVFYGAFRVPLIIPSPDYPQYKPHMRCPFVFRCDEDYDDCVIRLEFENFNLASNDVSRSRRQALNESDFGNGTAATTLAPYVPPTGPDFNRTICAGEDVVRVSQCGSISAINSREFCADNPPSQVYTGYKEVLMYFDSNDERQDQGFVIKFTPKDRRKWIYSDAELEPKCTCAHNLPNQIRKYFRKRNKNKTNKAKANKEPLRRVRREEREKLKERRTVEKEGKLPERRKRKQKNEENKDRSTNDQGKKREDDVEGPKRRRKKMKKMEGGDSNTEGQNKGKNGRDKEEKDGEKPQGRKKKRMNVGDKDRDAENQKKKNGGDIEENVNGPKRRRKNGGGGNEENAKRQKRRRKNGGGGNEENAKRQKRRRKKIGNTNASENEGGNQREQKKIAKDRRKDTLLEKKEKRLQRKNKNGEEDMPMTRAFNGKTNRKRQQYPWLVSVIQYERPLVKNKVKGDRPVERLCGGTLLSDRYVLTTTSCCTYCKTVWEKKNKKNIKLRKKRDAEGENNKMANKRKRRKKEEDKKGEVKEGEDDMDTEKKGGNQRRRRKNKKTNEELENGGNNRDKDEKAKGIGKGKGMKRGDKKTDKENDNDDDNKGKGKGKKKGDKKNDKENDNDDDDKGKGKRKKKGHKKKNDNQNDNDDANKNKKRRKGEKRGNKKKEDREKGAGNGQGDTAPRQNQNKRRNPLKKDVGAIIGEGSINIKKLGDVKPLKIGGIFIPSDCYDKMGKTELNGEPLYPVECPVLLKLKKKVKFNRFIKPMCMPIFDKIKINKERAASLGYGTRKASKTEPSKIPAEVINMRVLKKCEKRLKMKLDKTMICTKGKKKSGHMCFFDEGAPLLNVKVTGSGYKQHANLYGALVVPSCQLEDKKKKKNRREKRDTDENEPKEKRRKLRRRKQETPGTATASKPRQEAKRQGKEGAPGDRPKRKKKLRKMGDVGGEESQQTKPKKLRRKLGRQGQKDKKSILQDGGGDEYNPRKYNKFYIDVWVNIRSYKKWILNVVFNKKKAKACQRPKHFKSVPDIAKKFEIEDPCPF
ncbi:uncharacterized protein LOC119582851 isoform X35 [Penaeus monodon]|uniref:uncharacterized protein LOC119582851 isoform X35 n=1 Tax=Penaeus monodon TaxID=6687 RepID=UPI0018A7C9BB|nr:uncharacterized protein LOC119582851 isoform X35 [Penaeus monodon]